MQAAIIHAPFDMQLGFRQLPQPGPGEVRVSVRVAGICASDMYIYLGTNPYANYPIVAGHEIAGVVDSVGNGVVDLEPGIRVVVEPFINCGSCFPCRSGRSNCCARLQIIGIHRAGGYAEHLIAPAKNIHRVLDGMSFATASFAEPVAIAVHACRRGNVSTGQYVLILGCGPIGLALIEVAKARGARVVATDVLHSRLEIASRLGAEVVQADDEMVSTILDQTHGEGAPVVIEATGTVKAIEQTVSLVAAAGRIVIVGLVKEGAIVGFPGLDLTRKEMTIVGSRASVNCFPESLELLDGGAITYPRVATEFKMWEAPQVFARLAEDPQFVHKGLLVLEE